MIRRACGGLTLAKRYRPSFDGDGAQITFGGEETVRGNSTVVIARRESSDARAKRVFNEEYHQFSQGVTNVLVINLSAIADCMSTWPSLVARLLQPARNRKVGAVAFFHQGLLGPREAIRRRWRVLVNPHAHVPVPEALLASLESLDESIRYGLPRPQRLVAV
jgi:hypothetical protein